MNAIVSALIGSGATGLIGWVIMAVKNRRKEKGDRIGDLRMDVNHVFAENREDMNKRFAENREDMNKRFAENREDMNKRFAEYREDMNRQFTDHRDDMNRQFDEHREDMNQRFAEHREDMNRRFDEQRAESEKLWAASEKQRAASEKLRVDLERLRADTERGFSAVLNEIKGLEHRLIEKFTVELRHLDTKFTGELKAQGERIDRVHDVLRDHAGRLGRIEAKLDINPSAEAA